MVEDHAIQMMIQHSGYGDLGEDFGERAHQVENKLDKRFSAIRDFGKKENVKSRNEVKVSIPCVQVKKEEMLNKNKKRDGRVLRAHTEKENKKQKRDENRKLILDLEMPAEGSTLPSLATRRKLKLLAT